MLDAIGADSVHYCGESLGGILGMVLAAEQPKRVRTLNLIAAPVYINKQTQKTFAFGFPTWQDALKQLGPKGWSEKVNSSTRFPPDTDPGLLRWFAEEQAKSKLEVLVALSGLASQVNVSSYLPLIKAPVLGLFPSSGPITNREQEELLLSKIPNIKIIHLSTRFHSIQNILPASCAMQVLYFASQHDGTPCRE